MADRYWLQIVRPEYASMATFGFSELAHAVDAATSHLQRCPHWPCEIRQGDGVLWTSHNAQGEAGEPLQAFAARHGIFVHVAPGRYPQ